MNNTDFLIIGAGIIGLAIAKNLKRRYPEAKITILEKEPDVAYHSSGRNSGVLHSGFYYSADSLKAKFCRVGNQLMKEYCKEHKLKLNECQKVVVAKNESEVVSIFELEKRGKKNGVEVSVIDEKQLADFEPNAKTYQYALHSPNTATVDPTEVNQCIKNELISNGVIINFNEPYLKRIEENIIQTVHGNIYQAGIIINSAGLYADKIANQFGFSDKYTIIPFKGIYLKYTLEDKPVRTNIYPVPNLKNPWLGVHFTVTVDNIIKIGPNATPAFWRENYKGFDNFKGNESFNILTWEASLFLTNAFHFRSIAIDEIKKYNRHYFVGLASQLVKNINPKGFTDWTKPGIRAQLLNKKTKELVQDFVIEGDKKSIHVLNAVSPAFTSAFPFAEWILDNYLPK